MARSSQSPQTTVAVIGGGINGLCCAWQLALRGARVTLFERGKLMQETSSHTFRLMDGGLLNLSNLELRLVHESLRERHWWLQNCPELCREIRLTIPVYSKGPRGRRQTNFGLTLYEQLAGAHGLTPHRWLDRDELLDRDPDLLSEQLLGGYRYSEASMDDLQLGLWVAQQARAAGAQLMENSPVRSIGADGRVELGNYEHRFDAVVNAAGPWAEQLLSSSKLLNKHRVELVRGSYILFEGEPAQPYFFQTGRYGKAFFVLPCDGRSLVGTTEVGQTIDEDIAICEQEIEQLLRHYNRHFRQGRGRSGIVATHSGLLSLLRSRTSPRQIRRDYIIRRQRRLITVYGGTWTTSRALGIKVAEQLMP